jgi:hypothetical protein
MKKNLDPRSGMNISDHIFCRLSVTDPDLGSGMEKSSSGIRTGISRPDPQFSLEHPFDLESSSCSRKKLSFIYLTAISRNFSAFTFIVNAIGTTIKFATNSSLRLEFVKINKTDSDSLKTHPFLDPNFLVSQIQI